MRKVYLCIMLLLGSLVCGFSQFDTIAGPYSGTGAMTVADEKLYLLAAHDSPMEVIQIDVNTPDFERRSIFTNPFSTPALSLFVLEEDLYLACAGETVSQGLIRIIQDINSNVPTDEIYLELPWLPTNIAVRDSIMYISRLFINGGGIYSYDMTDASAQVELLIRADANSLTDFELVGDDLLISDGTDDRILSIDLSEPNPVFSNIQGALDFPSGIAVDDELLYVAVGNNNSNASSRVKVYDLNSNGASMPIAELATTTNLILLDVARLNEFTYVLEYPDSLTEEGYLLRIKESTNATQPMPQPVFTFPNPTAGLVTFDGVKPEQASVYDAGGRLVQSFITHDAQLDLSTISSGIYTVRLSLQDGTTRTARVVIE